MRARKSVCCILTAYFFNHFWHCFEVILIAVEKVTGEKVIVFLFIILLNKKITLMPLLESYYIGKTLLDLLLYTISIQLDYHLRCTQKRSCVLQLVQQHLKFSHYVIHTIHLDYQLGLFRCYFTHLLLYKFLQIRKVTIGYFTTVITYLLDPP
jgi:hypothetical protein